MSIQEVNRIKNHYCLELSTLVAIAEEFSEMNDFIAAAYSHPMTLELIRANDVEKVKQVFTEYTNGWDDERYTEMEAIVSGIEYATIMKTEHSASVPHMLTFRAERGQSSILRAVP
ncbi:MAG: hypothetical protein E7643_08285 [Ruminococcaceae bacterium]|nr:hypothetical protein [Oscillospiraceae bacterium]